VSYNFKNQEQKDAAKLILARCAVEPAPNRRQLANLVERRSDYDTKSSAREFVKNFVASASSPLTCKGKNVVRSDIKPVTTEKEVMS
jgi:hypothetical protein